MAEFEVGDRVKITRVIEYERVITGISSHGGGTDYDFDRGLPPPYGHTVSMTTEKLPPTKKQRRRNG